MSIVAPIAALGVVVPVGGRPDRGEAPGPIQLVGLVVAIAGVVVLSYEETEEHQPVAQALDRRSPLLVGPRLRRLLHDARRRRDRRPGWAIVFAPRRRRRRDRWSRSSPCGPAPRRSPRRSRS